MPQLPSCHEGMDKLTEALIREVLLHMGLDSTTPDNQAHVDNPVLRTMLASRVQSWVSQWLGIGPLDIDHEYANAKRQRSEGENRPIYQDRLPEPH